MTQSMKGTFFSRVPVALLATLVATLVIAPVAAVPLAAQDTTAIPTRLSLGEAGRIAARNTASAQSAQIRVGEARARVTQARSALLPSLEGVGTHFTRTLNTASFGFSLPGLNPNGEIIGPFRNVDMRGRAVAPLFDLGAFARVRSANSAVTAASAAATVASEQAATQAALAYVQAVRSEDDF
ncbi:MAG TPA: hypothetical protein VGT98_11555, partial [Candidatus Elarobacter sp.]|nr:hypothetical protein [Candidatus Elarobacter sp.]